MPYGHLFADVDDESIVCVDCNRERFLIHGVCEDCHDARHDDANEVHWDLED